MATPRAPIRLDSGRRRKQGAIGGRSGSVFAPLVASVPQFASAPALVLAAASGAGPRLRPANSSVTAPAAGTVVDAY